MSTDQVVVKPATNGRPSYGWRGALPALAAQRVADGAQSQARSAEDLFARAYLTLVCDFLRELEDDEGAARIEATYLDVRREYATAHETQAHSGRFEVWEPGWHEECWEWQQRYAPALRHLPGDA